MRYFNFLLLLCLLPVFAAAQHGVISERVLKEAVLQPGSDYTLVTTSDRDLKDVNVPEEALTQGTVLDLNLEAITRLQEEQPSLLRLTFPIDGEELVVELIPNKLLTDDFMLTTSDGQVLDYEPGLYYYGTLINDPSSLVAMSVFDNELHGIISTTDGNYVIGKIDGERGGEHLIYNDRNYQQSFELGCEMQDDGGTYKPNELEWDATKAVGDCIRVYIEIDDDIVTQKGGATNATNYITGLFNESITLYANESLDMSISQIFAWTTPAPYSGSSSSAMLSSYQSNTGSFNGDLSHLVSYQASGGIAAGFSGICNSNPDNSKCFSSIDATYNTVPSYSYSVMVVTHEMGHLIGSRHTHACVWNGNNTAIDGCSGFTEGSCPIPGNPPGGGTIMSYCHVATGIDFTQGFGPQPGNVIRNTVANANCLSPCGGGGGPTCTDGIQNGDETGVDCGGSSCPDCPTACNDNEVIISITLDNYPEETSWTVTNSSGSVVASGGTYGSQPDGSTVTETLCLADGCYDFTINDSYGDGICCSYGNGSYSVTSGGQTLASGGSFGSSETTNFCVGGATGPTCDDGIQNGDETGVDCGGSNCPACPTGGNDELLGSYFETGLDGWLDGGSDCFRYSGSRSYEGSYSIRLRDNSGTASSMTTASSYDITGYSAVEIKFYFYPNSMENGEDFWVRYNSGSGWQTVASYASGTSFNNNQFYVATVTLDPGQVNFTNNARFRFQCDASANADQVYIDQVTITGISGGLNEGIVEPTIAAVTPNTPVPGVGESGLEFGEELVDRSISIFPNPAFDVLQVRTQGEMASLRVMSATGQVLQTIQVNNEQYTLDIASLRPGLYYLLVEVDGEVQPQRFVKH